MAARLVNISIDDTYGDSVTRQKPVYQPKGFPWYNPNSCFSPGSCAASPNISVAFEETWTGAEYDALDPSYNTTGINITISFTGISIWIFFILPNFQVYLDNANSSAPTNTACNFTLDGNYMGSFLHVASSVGDSQYDAPVFSATGLDNSQHELVIWTKYSGGGGSFIIFDYAVYTADSDVVPGNTTLLTSIGSTGETPESGYSSSDNKLRIIIGCALVLGSIGVAVLVIVLLRFRRNGRKRKMVVEPYQQPLVGDSNNAMISNTTFNPQDWQSSNRSEYSGPSEGTLPDQYGIIHAHSFDSSDTSAALVPFLQFQSTYTPNGKDEHRAGRQIRINHHHRAPKRGMQKHSSRRAPAIRSGPGHGATSSRNVRRQETGHGMEIVVIREQICQLNQRIERLRTQLSSDEVQGLSDEPPPAYR